MKFEELPLALRKLISEYKSLSDRSISAWRNTSGNFAENAARVASSDRAAMEANEVMKEIKKCCNERNIDVEALLKL